jgi:nitroreductase
VRDLGAYGRMVNPPHYLVPYVLGQEHALEDAGYRVEQIAVRLAAMGIGSCFIGALRREDEVRARYSLPEATRIGAFLVFGYPSTSLGGRATNRLLRSASGASRKLGTTELFFEGSFENRATPSGRMAPLIEAARHAPSAANAQPWRFLWAEGSLYLFVATDSRRYGRGPQQEYRLHDGGAAMANITLAMEALNLNGRWELAEEAGPDVPKHAMNLQPLARLLLEDMG